MTTKRARLQHPSWTGADEEIRSAQAAMLRKLRLRWRKYSAYHEDFAADATVSLIGEPRPRERSALKAKATLLVDRVAADWHRRESRRQDKRNREFGPDVRGATAQTEACADPHAEDLRAAGQVDAKGDLQQQLERNTRPLRTVSITLQGELQLIAGPNDLEISKLEREMLTIATKWRVAATRRPRDKQTLAIADALLALTEPEFVAKVAGSARRFLEDRGLGLRSRARQASWLAKVALSRNAREIVNAVRSNYLLAADTNLPLFLNTDEDRARNDQAISKVQTILDAVDATLAKNADEQGRILAKRALTALGCPPGKAKNLFNYAEKRVSRGRGRAKR